MRLVLLKRKENAVGVLAHNELYLADTSVCDHHAIITCERGRYFVADLKSVSGTYLNGRRIRRRRPLTHGDNLRFGAVSSYRFIDPDAPMRRRRRMVHAAAAAAVLAAGVIVHLKRWDAGLLSPGRITEAAAVFDAQISSKPAATARVGPTVYLNSAPAPAQAGPSKPLSITAKIAAPSASPAIARVLSPPRGWLDLLNHYRAIAGLGTLRENSEASASMAAHTHYLLANFTQDIRSGSPIPQAYDEDPSRPGYSASAASQAHNSQLAWGCSSFDAGKQIDRWIASPFHRVAMLNPSTADTGFGSASDSGCWLPRSAFRLQPSASLLTRTRLNFPPPAPS
jgi:hypothetical protein